MSKVRTSLPSINAYGRSTLDEVDLFEINEAFAVVPMAAICELGLPANKVNVTALRKYGLKRGIAAICIGGGEATAMAVELGS